MNAQQFALIPDHLLVPSRAGCLDLIDWLAVRGWRMSLLDLDDERRRRGLPTGIDTRPVRRPRRAEQRRTA